MTLAWSSREWLSDPKQCPIIPQGALSINRNLPDSWASDPLYRPMLQLIWKVEGGWRRRGDVDVRGAVGLPSFRPRFYLTPTSFQPNQKLCMALIRRSREVPALHHLYPSADPGTTEALV